MQIQKYWMEEGVQEGPGEQKKGLLGSRDGGEEEGMQQVISELRLQGKIRIHQILKKDQVSIKEVPQKGQQRTKSKIEKARLSIFMEVTMVSVSQKDTGGQLKCGGKAWNTPALPLPESSSSPLLW